MAKPRQVLIIGASRGIGLEWVRQTVVQGDQVTASAREVQGLAAVRALGAHAIELDVADQASAAGLALQIEGSQFDQVVVAAGVYGPRSSAVECPSVADFDAVMHTNVLGPMRVFAQMEDALAPGAKVLVLSSLMGSIALRQSSDGWLYRASKAAVNSVLKDVSLRWAGQAICVCAHPGWVRTDMGGPSATLDVAQSVQHLRALVERLKPQDHGKFFNVDGQLLAW